MFAYMARAVIREKESFRALESWTCQLVRHVKNLLKIETPLNVICLTKVHLKCNYLNYDDSLYIKFSNKTWHCYNCSKDLLQQ